MKKWIAICLMALLLAGCATQEPPQTTAPTTVPTTQPPTDPPGLYDPDSQIQKDTAGTVRAYPLGQEEWDRLVLLDGQPLLLRQDGTMLLLEGEKAVPGPKLQLQGMDPATVVTGENTLACYIPAERQVVLLDGTLQQTDRFTLEAGVQGQVYISLEQKSAYYMLPGTLMKLDLTNGLTAMLRTFEEQDRTLAGCYFDGSMVLCVCGEDQEPLYVSTADGRTISKDRNILELYTAGTHYLAIRMDGVVRQQILGGEEDPRSLNLELDQWLPALELDCVLLDRAGKLELLDLTSGQVAASIDRSSLGTISSWAANEASLWLLDRQENGGSLYCWSPVKAGSQEECVVGPLYTALKPDTAALAACQERVDSLNKAHSGIQIRIYENALKVTGDYLYIPEHQPQAIHQMLDQLEQVMAEFPPYFLLHSADGGYLRINLVRSVESDIHSVQFWHQGGAYMSLCTGSDIRREFLLALGYLVDTQVRGNSRDYDDWDKLNPEGFTYYGTGEIPEEALLLLEGEDPAFANEESMRLAYEERRQLFCLAMSEEGAEVFKTPMLQKKLYILCCGIREAYNLAKSPETYPWEQYLQTSLAYVK